MLIAKNIKWDTDGEDPAECGLPDEVKIPDYITNDKHIRNNPFVLSEEVSDWLTEQFEFCHGGFTIADGKEIIYESSEN